MTQKLVLLDRDGVLNEDLPEGVHSPEQLRMLPGAAEAVALLCQAGFRTALVSNQSVVGRGIISMETLRTIHNKLARALAAAGGRLDAVYYCTDAPKHATHRRKPAPGMIEEALHAFKAQAATTPMVGDALRDMQAAYAAGCPRYLVRTGKGACTEANPERAHVQPMRICEDILDAATHIVQHYR